jgi:hypothetical protein
MKKGFVLTLMVMVISMTALITHFVTKANTPKLYIYHTECDMSVDLAKRSIYRVFPSGVETEKQYSTDAELLDAVETITADQVINYLNECK